MLQTLLMDRFNARVHRETRDVDGFVMTIAKSGIKFKKTSGNEQMPNLRIPPGTPSNRIPRELSPEGTGPSGGLIPFIMQGNYRMNMFAATLGDLLSPYWQAFTFWQWMTTGIH
jgi:uncharacterized protein (TIGR03435 family)